MKKALQLQDAKERPTRKPTAEEVVEFLENFKAMIDPRERLPLKLISIKVDVPLLDAFKAKAKLEGVPYQTKIKEIMRAWLQE